MWKRQWKWLKEHIQGRELSIVMVIHFGSMLLCGLIYVLLPDDVHLRWGLTYGLIWAALLSPIALMIAARKSRRKVVIRLYSALIGIALWLLAVFLQLIGGDIFLPPTCFCKDGDYLVRRVYDFFDDNMIGIYKVWGPIERRVSIYSYHIPDSIKVYESLNAIVLYCPSYIVEDPYVEDTIGPVRVIEQLYDSPMNPKQMKEVEQLAHRLNLKLGYTLKDYKLENKRQ